jgi:hypothetical protein
MIHFWSLIQVNRDSFELGIFCYRKGVLKTKRRLTPNQSDVAFAKLIHGAIYLVWFGYKDGLVLEPPSPFA